nr:MAG: replication associated protein [Cressdnaviricota sp.]
MQCHSEKEAIRKNDWSDSGEDSGEEGLLVDHVNAPDPTVYQLSEDTPPGSPLHGTAHQVMDMTPPASPAQPMGLDKPPKKFRMRVKNFFLTFPQCQTTKEVALDRLKERFPSGKLLVCHEVHQTGDDHLHVLIVLEEALSVSKADYFDFVGGKHGKYEPARNIRKSVEYITKKGDYISHGLDVDSILKKQAPKSSQIADLISDGKSLSQIDDFDRGYFMQNKRKIEEYHSWVSAKKARENLKPWVEFTEAQMEGMSSSSRQIAVWLNKNILKERPFKQAQLYIHGPRNMGKTTLITWLRNFVTVYSMPKSEDFYDSYEDNFYDLIVLDEFRAQKKVQDLNSWLEGSMMNVRKKGRQGEKRKNLPFIILSNYSLESAYRNSSDEKLDTLRCRLEFVEIETQLNLFTI